MQFLLAPLGPLRVFPDFFFPNFTNTRKGKPPSHAPFSSFAFSEIHYNLTFVYFQQPDHHCSSQAEEPQPQHTPPEAPSLLLPSPGGGGSGGGRDQDRAGGTHHGIRLRTYLQMERCTQL